MSVGIIDYGVGNLGSVLSALEALSAEPVLISRPVDMHTTDCLILPGVGNYADCARMLNDGGWINALREQVLVYGRPLLGICVGMQLLADSSAEGAAPGEVIPGLGLIPGKVQHLRSLGCNLRVPHVGWNGITRVNSDDQLLSGIPDDTDFYFVHSYAFNAQNPKDVLAQTDYGVPVSAVIRRGRIWGTQFHPEKSSRAGLRLLKNFIQGSGC